MGRLRSDLNGVLLAQSREVRWTDFRTGSQKRGDMSRALSATVIDYNDSNGKSRQRISLKTTKMNPFEKLDGSPCENSKR